MKAADFKRIVKTKEVKAKEVVKTTKEKDIKLYKFPNTLEFNNLINIKLGREYAIKYKFIDKQSDIFTIQTKYNTVFKFGMTPEIVRNGIIYNLPCKKVKTPIFSTNSITINSGLLQEAVKKITKINNTFFILADSSKKPIIIYCYDELGKAYAIVLDPVSNSNSDTNNIPIKKTEPKPITKTTKDPVKTPIKTKATKEPKKVVKVSTISNSFIPEKKDFKKESLAKDANSLLIDFAKSLDSKETEAKWQAMLKNMVKFYRYSIHNQVLIKVQSPNATRIGAYGFWKSHNRQVKKGSKGIMILIPVPYQKEVVNPKGELEIKNKIFFKTGYVFDISQTKGDPLPEPDLTVKGKLNPKVFNTVLEHIRAKVLVHFKELDNQTIKGYTNGKEIVINKISDMPTQFSTLIHEYTHYKLHFKDRSLFTKEQKEQQAESSAYAVMTYLGLDCSKSKYYIKSWDGNETAILEAMKFITSIVKEIIEVIEPPAKVEYKPKTKNNYKKYKKYKRSKKAS